MKNKKRHTLTLRCKTLQFHTIITAEPHNGHKSFVALSSAHKSLSLRPVLFNKQLFGASGTGYDHCGSTWTHDTGNDQRQLTIWAYVNLLNTVCLSRVISRWMQKWASMKHHDIFMSICPATELWTWRLFRSDLPPLNHQPMDINQFPTCISFYNPFLSDICRFIVTLNSKLMSKNPAKGMNLCTNPLQS